jgi:hypothetical protein
MRKVIRFECARCIHKGHNAVSCAARDLRWAMYHFMLTLPIFHNIAKMPEHCPNRLAPPACWGHFLWGAPFIERECDSCKFYYSCRNESGRKYNEKVEL